MRPRSLLFILATLTTLTSCGSSSSSTDSTAVDAAKTGTGKVRQGFEKFCSASDALDAALGGGPHGENPAAITDPAQMKTAWASIEKASTAVVAASPSELKTDAALMLKSIGAMKKVFQANNYSLLEMAKKPEVRDQLSNISSDKKVLDASTRFNASLAKNCGK
jgi:hypothetical protein